MKEKKNIEEEVTRKRRKRTSNFFLVFDFKTFFFSLDDYLC